MNIFKRIWTAITDKRAYTDPYESLYPYVFGYSGSNTEAGEAVNVRRGSRLSTAFSCINVLSQDVAKLPFNAMKMSDEGNQILRSDPVHRLLHSTPNNYTSKFNFWYRVVFDILSHGNSYAVIEYSGNRPSQLHQCHPDHVKPILIEDEIYYEIEVEGKKAMYSQEDILHFKMYSFDGIKGVSPIIYNAELFGYKIKQDKYKAKVLGAKPPGIITVDRDLNETQYNELIKWWKRQTNDANAGETPVMGSGVSYSPLMIPPNEGQMIEASELTMEEMAGIYRVPPTLIQNYRRATFSNAEQQELVYVKHALTPIFCVIEEECNRKLFGSRSGLFTKINFKGMLRGDIKTQTEWYRMALSHGLMTINEVRELEDLPALPGGDVSLVQGALVPLNMLESFHDNSQSEEMIDAERQLQTVLEKVKLLNGN